MRLLTYSGLMITSLLQVVNRLDVSWLWSLFIYKLNANIKLQLDEKQAGKIQNTHQVCGVSGFVILMTWNIPFHNFHPISLHIHSVPGIMQKCFCTLHIYLSTLDSCKMVGKGEFHNWHASNSSALQFVYSPYHAPRDYRLLLFLNFLSIC